MKKIGGKGGCATKGPSSSENASDVAETEIQKHTGKIRSEKGGRAGPTKGVGLERKVLCQRGGKNVGAWRVMTEKLLLIKNWGGYLPGGGEGKGLGLHALRGSADAKLVKKSAGVEKIADGRFG